MREVVVDLATKCFFHRMAQTLGQMFGGCGNRKLVALAFFQLQNSREWIVVAGPFRFVEYQILNVSPVLNEKGAVKINKSARLTFGRLFARWTDCHSCSPLKLILLVTCRVLSGGPATIRVDRSAFFTNRRFTPCPNCVMTPTVMIDAFSKSCIGKWFIAAHSIELLAGGRLL